MNTLIATHDSATGEPAGNFISKIGSIFAKTQNKTIFEQYEAGCRLFDLRVRCDKLYKNKNIPKINNDSVINEHYVAPNGVEFTINYDPSKLIKCLNDYELCHGLWKCDSSLEDILYLLVLISSFHHSTENKNDIIWLGITYEGSLTEEQQKIFLEEMLKIDHYGTLKIAYIAVKKPKWKTLYSNPEVKFKANYTKLDGSSWHTLIPIPWLWNKLRTNKHVFNTETFTMVDFL